MAGDVEPSSAVWKALPVQSSNPHPFPQRTNELEDVLSCPMGLGSHSLQPTGAL
jgi:hypothetical protein